MRSECGVRDVLLAIVISLAIEAIMVAGALGVNCLVYRMIQADRIDTETGCKVTLWSPGQQRGCTPFNISNNENNVTAWLCCPSDGR